MTTPKIQVTGFIKTPEGRYQMRINGVPHWTDMRGWGLYTSATQMQVTRTGFRKIVRVSKVVASASEFRLPADAELASLVVEQDLVQLAARRRAQEATAKGLGVVLARAAASLKNQPAAA